MHNPFKEDINEDKKDTDYIIKSVNGDAGALENLLLRHHSWIFNIAVKMTGDIHDAEDVTQEVLIKVITKLSTYSSRKSSFRTWLYRIVANHVINMKTGKKEKIMAGALLNNDIEDLASGIPDRRKSGLPGHDLMIEETKTSCMNCMLLSLKRKERIIFILGVVFNVTDKIGSELCDISRENFRKILSRTRKKLYDFFNTQCSLLNESNPCRCDKKITSMIKLKLVDPDLALTTHYSHGSIQEILGETVRNIEDSYYEFNLLFHNQPFYKNDMIAWFRELINKRDIRNIFNVN